jgi:hypothetical protein
VFTFHLAWRALDEPGRPSLEADHAPPLAPPCPLPAPTGLRVVPGPGALPVVTVAVDPASLSLLPAASPPALHYFRLADATVKPLPPAPPALTFDRGDAYVAVTPGTVALAADQPGGASAALARFIHLRDYFNADKLAAALLEHAAALGGAQAAPGAGVLVIELR